MLICDILMNGNPPSDIPDNIQTMSAALTGIEVNELPSLEYVVVSGLQAVCHVRIMRRWSSNLEQWTIQRPRLWVPSPYSLSLTRGSKPAFQ